MHHWSKEVIDLSNRSRRNNVLLYNVPEGEEKKSGNCLTYAEHFLENVLEMDPVPKLEVAHRSGVRRVSSKATDGLLQAKDSTKPQPRMMVLKCVYRDDRDRILEAGSKKLKESKYYLTDDLHPETRKIHNKLVPIMKEMRKKGYLAFIPWTVPRLIKYKDSPKGTPGPIKVYRLGEGTVDG